MQPPAYRLVLERARREERLHEGLRGGRVGPQGQRVERREKAEAKRCRAQAPRFASVRATEQEVALTKFMPNAVECTRRAVHRSVLQSTRQHSCCREIRDDIACLQVRG